jgi:hypothetical protein
MKRAELHRLARIGAETRLETLQREIAAIHATFPELGGARSTTNNPYTAGVRKAVAGVRGAVEGAVTRRRPKMSAAARKRIAEAQKRAALRAVLLLHDFLSGTFSVFRDYEFHNGKLVPKRLA